MVLYVGNGKSNMETDLMERRKMPLTITEEMIKQDLFFEMGLERGLKEGEKKGLEKGLKEGEKRGLEKGKELG